MSLPVALVVDTGVDDALALVVAARHPDLSLVAVVATAGNAPLEQTAANTLAVLAAAGVDDVPVGRGSARRLDGAPYPSRGVHGLDGLGGRGPAALDHASLGSLPAAERVLGALPEDVLVVCLAPLTCLVGLPRRRVLASFAAAGQANAVADPEAERLARAGHDVVAEPPPAAVPLPLGGTRGLTRALLAHRGSRGPGDAATVLRLAGSHDPVGDLVALLEPRVGEAWSRRGAGG